VGCSAVSSKIKFCPEFWRDFAPLNPRCRSLHHGALGCCVHGREHGPSVHGHWSRAGAAGNPLVPSGAGAGRANPGSARLGWGRSLFLETLETSREGPAFSFPSFIDGVILICDVFVQGFFYCYYLFMSCLFSVASEKRSRNTAKADGKPRARLFGRAKAARPQTRRGRECLCHEMSVLCISLVAFARFGDAERRREPAGFHLGHSLIPHCLAGTLGKLQFSMKLGSKTEPKWTSLPLTGDIGLLIPFATYSTDSQPSLFLAGGLPSPCSRHPM